MGDGGGVDFGGSLPTLISQPCDIRPRTTIKKTIILFQILLILMSVNIFSLLSLVHYVLDINWCRLD